MRKYEMLKCGDSILRVLELQQDKVLVLDCIKKTMPVWVEANALLNYSSYQAEKSVDPDTLTADQRKLMYQRYTMISPVLPFIADEKMRSQMIQSAADQYEVSKQTIRSYLCQYLADMEVTALAPKIRKLDPLLSQDEKNMRWALNKFFYTRKKNSLMTSYTMMLKAKYCNSMGVLFEDYPTFHQFRYFYRKTKKLQNYYISRDGLTHYQRNNRPLTGEGVQEFAPNVGTGMLDATICDIYLVNDAGSLVGRPILTACIDAYSGLCCGYSLSWEGGVYSLRGLLLNVIADKVEWCKKFGISIKKEDWDCSLLPATLVTDKGSEYKSENFEQIAELGVTVINLPPYRPELKGMVEKFFDLVQTCYKKHLKGKGVIEPDYQERGAHDYRKDACLTLRDFEKVILRCIIYYNSQRVLGQFPYSEEMIAAGVQPYASSIWNWGRSQIGDNLISVHERDLLLTLLPRTTGRFSRQGLTVNKLRYHRDGLTEQYLSGGEVVVAYNPEDVTSVWLVKDGNYVEVTLIESRFHHKDLKQVQEMQSGQRSITRNVQRDHLQAQINLAQHIETIAESVRRNYDVQAKDIRDTRNKERNKQHRDYMTEGANHD